MRRRAHCLLAFLCATAVCLAPAPAAAAKVRAAVLTPFASERQDAATFAESFPRLIAADSGWDVFSIPNAVELAGANRFRLISEGKSPRYAASLGRKVEANKVISGQIKRFGRTLLLKLDLTDVDASTVERSFVHRCRGADLPEALKAASARLAGKAFSPNIFGQLKNREEAIALTCRARDLEAENRLAQAGKMYAAALALDPKTPEAHQRLASVRKRIALVAQRSNRLEELYAKYLADTKNFLAEGKHEEALTSFGKARSVLYARGEKQVAERFSTEAWYGRMMSKLKSIAEAHEKKGEWLKAYSIYAYLRADRSDDETLTQAIKRCDHNFAVENRYKKEFVRGEAKDRTTPRLFDDIIRAVERFYDGKPDYRKATIDANESIELLAGNRKVREYWTTLNDEKARERFLKGLRLTRKALEEATEVESTDVRKALREIVNLNRETARLPDGVIAMQYIYGLAGAQDDHSNFFPELTYRTFVENARGEFAGIGVQITTRNGWLTVVVPLEDHPAIKVGVRAGDRISKIEGEEAYQMTLDEAVHKLRGQKGTPVTITVLHKDDPNPKDPTPEQITIVRDRIRTDSVLGCSWDEKSKKWSYMIDDEFGIGYIRITNFQESTPREAALALRELSKHDLNGMVVDLRFDTGGLLASAIKLSDMFLSSGVIVSSKGRVVPREVRSAYDDSMRWEHMPIVVLINASSASASEIFAAALRENGRATLVGVPSFGKGSVQQIFPLELESGASGAVLSNLALGRVGIKLTIARYYTPAGTSIEGKGVQPDYNVEIDDAEISALARDLRSKRFGDYLSDPDGEKESRIIFEIPREQFIDRQLNKALYLLRSQLLGLPLEPASKPATRKAA